VKIGKTSFNTHKAVSKLYFCTPNNLKKILANTFELLEMWIEPLHSISTPPFAFQEYSGAQKEPRAKPDRSNQSSLQIQEHLPKHIK